MRCLASVIVGGFGIFAWKIGGVRNRGVRGLWGKIEGVGLCKIQIFEGFQIALVSQTLVTIVKSEQDKYCSTTTMPKITPTTTTPTNS